MTRRPETLDDLRVGDEVAIIPGNPYAQPQLGKVEKLTKAQVTVNGLRYRRGRGFIEIGANSMWSAFSLKAIDADILSQIDKAKRAAAAKSLAEAIAKADLTHDQIARIRAALDGSEG